MISSVRSPYILCVAVSKMGGVGGVLVLFLVVLLYGSLLHTQSSLYLGATTGHNI